MTSQPIRLYTNFITLIPNLTFTELQEVSTEQFATDLACKQGTLTLPDISFHMFYALIVKIFSPNLPWFLDFSLRISLGTFSILTLKCASPCICGRVWIRYYWSRTYSVILFQLMSSFSPQSIITVRFQNPYSTLRPTVTFLVCPFLKAGPLRLKQLTNTLTIRILSQTSILYLIRYASVILTAGLHL